MLAADTAEQEKRRVSIPRLDEMRDRKYGSEQYAYAADYHVGNAHERVPAAHDGRGGDDDGLCTAVQRDGEV